MISNNHADVLSRLDAMRAQEKNTRCRDYFNSNACRDVDDGCRKAMVTWVQQVQKSLSLSPETVWIAMSYFDRYLSSGRGRSREVLRGKRKFQLAAITAFYMAVKMYEPVVLGIDLMAELCQGTYTECEFASMEREILASLGWRVSVHTPLDFVRHLLELLPEKVGSFVSECLVEACTKKVEHATSDLYLSCCKPSVLGISCLATSLAENDEILPAERRVIWTHLSELCHFDLSSAEITRVQLQLPSRDPLCGVSNAFSKLATSSKSIDAGPSSPICVTRTARQA